MAAKLETLDSALNVLDAWFDTGKGMKIAEGRRIEFFEGKRKLKNGEIKKTGHHYWQWSYRTDTGRRKRAYGGVIATVPDLYQYRRRQYEAIVCQRSPISLADALLRPALAEMRNGDTGA